MAYAMLARNASRQMDLARPVGVLAHDEDARTFLMVVVVEFIPAWLQWLQANYGFAIAADDLSACRLSLSNSIADESRFLTRRSIGTCAGAWICAGWKR